MCARIKLPLLHFVEITVLLGHTNFVQGVTWDPFMQFAATQSADKSIRVYTLPSRSAQVFSSTSNIPLAVANFTA